MADFADLGAAREEEPRRAALAEHARATRQRQVTVAAETCAVCGTPIPEARRQAVSGVQTCVDCAAELEAALQRTHGRCRRPRGP